MLLPFEIDDRDEGVLRLCRPGVQDLTESDIASCESLAQVLGVAIASRRAQAALTERVKELTCMYGIARVAATAAISEVCSSDAASRRSRIPVLARIHSSEVSTVFSRSELVRTRAGT